ncbi:MAG: FmdE family protein [Pseudomonadota bacterium]
MTNKIDNRMQPPSTAGVCKKDFLMAIENFHGRQAPGLVLGGLMVDLGIELLGGFSDPAAVVETQCFLPDAVQVLTPCTIGNGRLVILDWGKMALCLYDKNKLAGYRIWLDLKKARPFPRIYNWHMHLSPEKELRDDPVIEDILCAGRSILSWRAVPITQPLGGRTKQTLAVCPRCEEAYPVVQGDKCLSCQGETYFELPEETAGESLESSCPAPCNRFETA